MTSGTCMCGHTSSLHTGPGGSCAAKFINPHTRKQETCNCTYFVDKDGP